MTIQEIYDLALNMAIKADPRGEAFVKKLLAKAKVKAGELTDKEKRFFDKESLKNPYSDSRILVGDPNTEVKKVLAGIDVSSAEVLLMDRLNEKGGGFDLFISHHPEGHALAGLHGVMDLQVDMYAAVGVPVNVAHALISKRMKEVELRFHPLNHTQAIDTARLLGVPVISLHTIWDNIGNKFMQDFLEKRELDTVGEVLDCMLELPEYQEAMKGKAGPIIVSGNSNSRAGKIVLFFTGGTNPSKELYAEFAKAGIGTVIDMHMNTDAIMEMRKLNINVINAGHMVSDSIGANIFLDVLEERGIDVVACSGLIRVKRGGKKKK
jgi:putative NIF3 family GTP cyclohydrolase 1 type 2